MSPLLPKESIQVRAVIFRGCARCVINTHYDCVLSNVTRSNDSRSLLWVQVPDTQLYGLKAQTAP